MRAGRSLYLASALMAASVFGTPRGHAAGPDPTSTVTGFLGEVRAGKDAASLARWWDGPGMSRQIFGVEWDALDGEERAEISEVVSRMACRGFLRDGTNAGPDDKGPLALEFDAPRRGEDQGGLASVEVIVRTKHGGETRTRRHRFLLSPGSGERRLVDWTMGPGPSLVEGIRLAREALHAESALVFAWRDLASLYLAEPVEPPPTSAIYKPRSPRAPEWLTRDLPLLDLPVIPGAGADRPVPAPGETRGGPDLVVNLETDGDLSFRKKGRTSPFVAHTASGPDPGFTALALEELRLVLVAARQEARVAPRLILRVDRRARWDVAFAAAVLATSADIGAAEVVFPAAGGRGDDVLVARFPRDSFLSEVPAGEEVMARTFFVSVTVARESAEDPRGARTRVQVGADPAIRLPAPPATEESDAQEAWEAAVSAAMGQVRQDVRRAAAQAGSRQVEGLLIALPPHGGEVYAGDILHVAGVMRAALGSEVRLVSRGREPPRPARGGGRRK